MKKSQLIITALSLLFGFFLLSGCSGSDNLQGTWKVQDASGQNGTIEFKEKTVIVDGEEYDYTQNAVGTENGVTYYGIKQNGQNYSIIFPEDDDNLAIMLEVESTDNYLEGTMLYAMNKSKSPNYQSYAKKYMN
ncbi:glycosyltransferase [Streptococcus sp. H49]|uniref:glycosyltransferase n=1 Tax=Streptococcus huangxiaojuni TaxID=3237239 RepID=UPI0034A25AC9